MNQKKDRREENRDFVAFAAAVWLHTCDGYGAVSGPGVKDLISA